MRDVFPRVLLYEGRLGTRCLSEVVADSTLSALRPADLELPGARRRLLEHARARTLRLVLESEALLPRLRGLGLPGFDEMVSPFQDKCAFRQGMAGAAETISPASVTVCRAEIAALDGMRAAYARVGTPAEGRLVIKPVRGSASELVFVCRDDADWERSRDIILRSPPSSARVDRERFVLERYVEGDELAVDVYFSDGAPIILGIYEHPFAHDGDVRDTIYRTSASTMRRYRPRLEAALRRWGRHWGIADLAAHVEVRVRPDGLFPVEVNPLRFGLLTADLSAAAFGINPYTYFFSRRAPDWDAILSSQAHELATSLIVGDVPEERVPAGRPLAPDLGRFLGALRGRGLEVLHGFLLPASERPYVCAAYVRGPTEAIDAFLSFDFATILR
ncbi:MAG TPA: ATP-grasp domain-containing protein [Polyangiaceae bacterium]|nr:ATP-grasp domain-containing protein [Polyangiaceae bacterium]